jgi:DNA-binding ferritin-like protein
MLSHPKVVIDMDTSSACIIPAKITRQYHRPIESLCFAAHSFEDEPLDMLAELAEDNRVLATSLRRAHNICDKNGDIATASLIEAWLDEAQRRNWFLYEASRDGELAAH